MIIDLNYFLSSFKMNIQQRARKFRSQRKEIHFERKSFNSEKHRKLMGKIGSSKNFRSVSLKSNNKGT
jgi:hypothetical protein